MLCDVDLLPQWWVVDRQILLGKYCNIFPLIFIGEILSGSWSFWLVGCIPTIGSFLLSIRFLMVIFINISCKMVYFFNFWHVCVHALIHAHSFICARFLFAFTIILERNLLIPRKERHWQELHFYISRRACQISSPLDLVWKLL